MPAKRRQKAATYREALEILSEMARGGDVRAAVALAGHLRKENVSDGDENEQSKVIKLASARTARTG